MLSHNQSLIQVAVPSRLTMCGFTGPPVKTFTAAAKQLKPAEKQHLNGLKNLVFQVGWVGAVVKSTDLPVPATPARRAQVFPEMSQPPWKFMVLKSLGASGVNNARH